MHNTIFLQKETLSDFVKCPYLENQMMRFEFMYILKISGSYFNELLENGWRRFGYFFFRPCCPKCSKCLPIRVKVDLFKPLKSLKRIINKNINIDVFFENILFKNEYFDIYKEHSKERFGQESDINDFRSSFFPDVVKSFHSNFYYNNKLIASGFLDISNHAASSVYFYYKTEFDYLSLGTYSVMKEIQFAKENGLNYYYIGYYIKENKHMSYKNRFKPYQLFDWSNKKWIDYE